MLRHILAACQDAVENAVDNTMPLGYARQLFDGSNVGKLFDWRIGTIDRQLALAVRHKRGIRWISNIR